MRWKKWLWGFAALPFIGLPLIAQESTRPQPAGETAVPAPGTAQPAATPAAPAATAPAAESPEPVSTEEQRPADEKISADNNLSFPVDI